MLNEKLHKVYSPPDKTGLIKLRAPECAVCMWRARMNKELYSGSISLKEHFGGIFGDGVIV
jgi:hypothetical protein